MPAEEHPVPNEGSTAVTRAMDPAEAAGAVIGRYHLLRKAAWARSGAFTDSGTEYGDRTGEHWSCIADGDARNGE